MYLIYVKWERHYAGLLKLISYQKIHISFLQVNYLTSRREYSGTYNDIVECYELSLHFFTTGSGCVADLCLLTIFPYALSQEDIYILLKKKKSLCFCFLLFSFCYWRFLCQSLLACFFDSNCSPKALNLSPVRDDLSSLLLHSVFVKRHMMVTLCYSSPCMVKSKSMSKWCSYKTFLIAFLYKDI